MFANTSCIWYNKNMEKNMFNINNNELSYGRGYVYSLQYHLVWCTKYRKKVLKDGIDTECKEMLCDLAEEYKFQILAMEVMPGNGPLHDLDHIRDIKLWSAIYKQMNMIRHNLHSQDLKFIFLCKTFQHFFAFHINSVF